MKTYKVIALSVGGMGNKIFNSGDIVNDNNFREGRAADLVKQGFLIPLSTEESKEEPTVTVEEGEEKTIHIPTDVIESTVEVINPEPTPGKPEGKKGKKK